MSKELNPLTQEEFNSLVRNRPLGQVLNLEGENLSGVSLKNIDAQYIRFSYHQLEPMQIIELMDMQTQRLATINFSSMSLIEFKSRCGLLKHFNNLMEEHCQRLEHENSYPDTQLHELSGSYKEGPETTPPSPVKTSVIDRILKDGVPPPHTARER